MSSLAWIDFDEAERQRAQRIMALFQERESRDELGLGSIRDAIADHLFPGTSTIQTRLRYMLFIPWLYRMLETKRIPEDKLRSEARALEIGLAVALKAGGEFNGIIGRDAGAALQRLPSSVYWAGLGSWGIRLFPGSIDSLFSTLTTRSRLRAPADPEDVLAIGQMPGIWVATLPPTPKGLLEETSFQMSADEAQFILDRLVASQPDSLLTFLAREGDQSECDSIWMHPHISSFPSSARVLIHHGAIFAKVMHGAALLYNLALSRSRNRDDWSQAYTDLINEWSNVVDVNELRHWSLTEFWGVASHPSHSITPAAKDFVTQWRELLLEGGPQAVHSLRAQQIVRSREERLKGSQSRFVNRAVLDRWTGASGVGRFGYRWSQAKSHLKDLANAG